MGQVWRSSRLSSSFHCMCRHCGAENRQAKSSATTLWSIPTLLAPYCMVKALTVPPLRGKPSPECGLSVSAALCRVHDPVGPVSHNTEQCAVDRVLGHSSFGRDRPSRRLGSGGWRSAVARVWIGGAGRLGWCPKLPASRLHFVAAGSVVLALEAVVFDHGVREELPAHLVRLPLSVAGMGGPDHDLEILPRSNLHHVGEA